MNISTIYAPRLKKNEEKNEREDEDGEERRPGDCVEVRVGEAGRYVVATRDIQVVKQYMNLNDSLIMQ